MRHVVTADDAGKRIDAVVARLSGASRSLVVAALARGEVTLNGAPVKPSRPLEEGDAIEFTVSPRRTPPVLPEAIDLPIAYEDDDLIVVDKPAGMVTHPAHGVSAGTLVNALLGHAGAGLPGDPVRAGLVHRLDRDTSGLLVVAKNAPALSALGAAMKAREIKREYVGLVHGVPEHRSGTIEGPIGRDPRNRLKYAVTAEGKPAITHYEIRDTFPAHAELVFRLETGRTHQIRVHLATLGHPLLNDATYGRPEPRYGLVGQALHAWRLSFRHPRTGKPLAFEAVPPPAYARARDAVVSAHFELLATDAGARCGVLHLAHGDVRTPCFMPVGTAASVKGLTPDDVRAAGAQMILANAYHLWLRPGLAVLEAAGGLHRFMAWDGPILTDSGGFQVFSLESKRTLDDDGVTFRSHLDGSEHRFTPEGVVAFQEALGVDVAMALDVCVKLPATREQLERAVGLTSAWASRCAQTWTRGRTSLFAIVQGGLDRELRERSARDLVALDLPGYAIGGLSVGETREELEAVARFTAGLLPERKPRYLMGVGTVRDLVAAVDCGIDLFDCVYPTRCGRNGRAMTHEGEFNIFNACYAQDFTPLDARCGCSVCTTFTRAYLAHLFRAKEMLGPRLLSYHNVHFLNDLMRDARNAVEHHTWKAFRTSTLD